jgi:mRNA interferase RelE/StbE
MAQPQYRLRVNELRVFYDVVGAEVQILAIVAKSDVEHWLQEAGTHEEGSTD